MKLTPEHFELFKSECQKRLEQLGLKSWNIYYQFKPLKDCFGRAEWNYLGRVATIICATDYPKPFDDLETEIKRTALHECLEIFLGTLTDLAVDRSFCRAEFDKEVHTVIRVLEKVL